MYSSAEATVLKGIKEWRRMRAKGETLVVVIQTLPVEAQEVPVGWPHGALSKGFLQVYVGKEGASS